MIALGVVEQGVGGQVRQGRDEFVHSGRLGQRDSVGRAEAEGPEPEAVAEVIAELPLEGLGIFVGVGGAEFLGLLAAAGLARLDHDREVLDPALGHAQEIEPGRRVCLASPGSSGP